MVRSPEYDAVESSRTPPKLENRSYGLSHSQCSTLTPGSSQCQRKLLMDSCDQKSNQKRTTTQSHSQQPLSHTHLVGTERQNRRPLPPQPQVEQSLLSSQSLPSNEILQHPSSSIQQPSSSIQQQHQHPTEELSNHYSSPFTSEFQNDDRQQQAEHISIQTPNSPINPFLSIQPMQQNNFQSISGNGSGNLKTNPMDSNVVQGLQNLIQQQPQLLPQCNDNNGDYREHIDFAGAMASSPCQYNTSCLLYTSPSPRDRG